MNITILILIILILTINTTVGEEILSPLQVAEKYVNAHIKFNWKDKYQYILNEYKKVITLEEYEEASSNVDLIVQKLKEKYSEQIYDISYGWLNTEWVFRVFPTLDKVKFEVSEVYDEDECEVTASYEQLLRGIFRGVVGKTIFLKKEEGIWKVGAPFLEINKYNYIHYLKADAREAFDIIWEIYSKQEIKKIEEMIEKYILMFKLNEFEGIEKILSKERRNDKEKVISKRIKYLKEKNIKVIKIIDKLITIDHGIFSKIENNKVESKRNEIAKDFILKVLGADIYLLISKDGKLMFGEESMELIREDGEWKISSDTAFESLYDWDNVKPPPKLTADEIGKEINKLIEGGHYGQAEDIYNILLEKYPNFKGAKELKDKIIEVKFLEAKKCLEKGYGEQEVLEFYNKLKKEYPDSKWTKELEKLMDKETEKNIK